LPCSAALWNQLDGLGGVFGSAISGGQHCPEVDLAFCNALFGGFAVPLEGFASVSGHFLPCIEHVPPGCTGGCVALCGGFAVPFESFGSGLFGTPSPFRENPGKVVLGGARNLFRRRHGGS